MMRLQLLFLLLLTSCASNKEAGDGTLKFPAQEELTYTTITEDLSMKFTVEMYVKDSVILIQGNDGEHCFFSYHKQTGARLKDFFQIGRGPFEGVAPGFVEMTGDSCMIKESNLRRGYVFSLSGLLKGEDHFYREFQFDFPNERTQMMVNHPVNLGDNRYLMVVPFSHEERFAIYTNPYTPGVKAVKHIYREYPPVIDERAKEANAAILGHLNQYAVSPDKSKCVHLSFIGAVAETFELQKDTMLPLAMKTYLKPEYELIGHNITPKSDGMIGFGDVIASNRYFYAIYYNTPYNKENDRIITVFDWKLNPIKAYQVKDRILNMVLDSQTGDVYAVMSDVEKFTYKLVRFDKKFAE